MTNELIKHCGLVSAAAWMQRQDKPIVEELADKFVTACLNGECLSIACVSAFACRGRRHKTA